MQKRKENVRLELIRAARGQFLNRGFKDTSMRTIAAEAGVGLSNIYNYFKNKDQLFKEVLAPTIQTVERAFKEQKREQRGEGNFSYDIVLSDELPQQFTRFFTDLIVEHREELKILMFNSHGSALESYREELIERHTHCELEYLRLLKEEHPEINADVSEFFIHTMSSFWINTFCELVMHEISRESLERFIGEYMEFATAGWKHLMGVR